MPFGNYAIWEVTETIHQNFILLKTCWIFTLAEKYRIIIHTTFIQRVKKLKIYIRDVLL